MSNIGVCIEPFFSGETFEQKLRNISRIGFSYYEFWFHDKKFTEEGLISVKKDFNQIKILNEELGLTTSDFVLNHPDGGIIAALINRNDTDKILDNLKYMIDLAHKIDCKKFISGSGNKISSQSNKDSINAMVDSLGLFGEACKAEEMEIILEPFNSRVDHPQYFLDNPETAVAVIKEVDLENVKILFDIYHMQIMYGNILNFIKTNLQYIGHFHIAGVPGRHEPIENELNYPFIIKSIEDMGYTGIFGLEYWPTMESNKSLENSLRILSGQNK